MTQRTTCAHCNRPFNWNEAMTRICNPCFLAGVDGVRAVAIEAAAVVRKVKKTRRVKCYVCAPGACTHEAGIPRPAGTPSRLLTDKEAARVVVPAHHTVKATSLSFLTVEDRTFQPGEAQRRYAEVMGCEVCAGKESCRVHRGAISGRGPNGEWYDNFDEVAA